MKDLNILNISIYTTVKHQATRYSETHGDSEDESYFLLKRGILGSESVRSWLPIGKGVYQIRDRQKGHLSKIRAISIYKSN